MKMKIDQLIIDKDFTSFNIPLHKGELNALHQIYELYRREDLEYLDTHFRFEFFAKNQTSDVVIYEFEKLKFSELLYALWDSKVPFLRTLGLKIRMKAYRFLNEAKKNGFIK
jgi:hypothetical protein